jgi:hypothetical protein
MIGRQVGAMLRNDCRKSSVRMLVPALPAARRPEAARPPPIQFRQEG